MAYQYNKGLDQLKAKAVSNGSGLAETLRIAFLVSIAYLFISFIYPVAVDSNGSVLSWREELEAEVTERVQWLEMFPLGNIAGTVYLGIAKLSTSVFISDDNLQTPDTSFGMTKIKTWSMFLARYVVSSVLLLCFLLMISLPFWIVGIGFGVLSPRYKRKNVRVAFDILTVCDRGGGPFYSGIHGPWRGNSKPSGMDFSAPNVACPVMVEPAVASGHKLTKLIEQISPDSKVSELLGDLVRIVLAIGEFPTFIPPESPSDDDFSRGVTSSEIEVVETQEEKDELSVESNALRSVAAFVQAYRFLEIEFSAKDGKTASVKSGGATEKNSEIMKYRSKLEARRADFADLEFALLSSLSPRRAQALISIPLHVCVASLLSLEAGKCLVFQKTGTEYTRISRFPHLQARSVIQSLPSYHRAYDGESRQILRLAILCSRRHGDYGRPMIPNDCIDSIRGLRQWLEISQSHSKKIAGVSKLVEFENQLEEWHGIFIDNLKKMFDIRADALTDTTERGGPALVGFPYKNVVLIPLGKLIDLAFADMPESHLDYLERLTAEVVDRGLLPRVTTRLPGLSEQIEQLKLKEWPADSSASSLAQNKSGNIQLRRWKILRHSLTRYSWLSTRIGDELVPDDGLVQALIYGQPDPMLSMGKPIGGLSSLVPIRKRRFHVLFGENWQVRLYAQAPSEQLIKVFTKFSDFQKGINTEGSNNVKGADI